MKVIVASFCKTGTKSINEALQNFGYNVYDWMEHFWYHSEDWKRIVETGATVADFKRMYEGVDAVIDTPSFLYWDKVLEAFPDAKVILMVREESTWLKSMQHELHSEASDPILIAIQTLSYSGWKYFHYCNMAVKITNAAWRKWPWSKYELSSSAMTKIYHEHNANVIKNVPKEKLLLFNLKNGWSPLCEFIGEEVPDKPFPHANKSASIMIDYISTSPIMQRMVKETLLTIGVLAVAGVWCGYSFYKKVAVSFLKK